MSQHVFHGTQDSNMLHSLYYTVFSYFPFILSPFLKGSLHDRAGSSGLSCSLPQVHGLK